MVSRTRSALYLIIIIYSAVHCETSSILNLFKRSQSSSSPTEEGHPPGGGSSSGDSSTSGNLNGLGAKKTSEESTTTISSVLLSRSDKYGSSHGNNIKKKEGEEDIGTTKTRTRSSHGKKTGFTPRGGGGWGWGGWGGGGHHDSNLDLYSLLGGLSFASLLGATIVYLARNRNSGTMVVMTNSTGRRRRALGQHDDYHLDEQILGYNLPEFMDKLGVSLNSPWWDETTKKSNIKMNTEGDKKKFEPFNLLQ